MRMQSSTKRIQNQAAIFPLGEIARRKWNFPNCIFSHPCPKCGAPPWCWCVTRHGDLETKPHGARSIPIRAESRETGFIYRGENGPDHRGDGPAHSDSGD
jgi:hypothetical protein